ncbi:MAG: phosphonoacetaldehyde hydrolase [Alphaproteobacteria bacterium]|jgi:phosphonoacetaldehyde hydrolase|nr:phosphonoacetaldehyde hydrolase [Rhodospirillaceae bacterium]MBT6205530.1 phosphonoacetaldehyde hydrolase [Rhodospirillaceae bacterium]MBT6511180.1 phosphonoacetaldehyde hydrolase [Rhodospirillaceae bacterium]MBT7614317.1 phosphonoacetaldehyde hydrolase [Rhodospirillaceae bacterium]MDG2481713.1 phosphonoacetaldehyde hydrolase [Alphaproteobacteria bacterium]
MSKFKAAVFDWAGTMVDFGSFAPMGVFVEAFGEFGIEASVAEARAPMGMAKWDHIHTMLQGAGINAQWQARHGAAPTDADVDAIYKIFVPMNEKVVAKYADLVPGALDMIHNLRARGMKIGSTTGYTRSIMANVLPVAAAQGYEPDNLICSDDLIEGRPGPIGMYQCFVDLGVYPPSAVIKVDDTEPGIAEGIAAGCLTVGVSISGNYVGKTPDELAAMSEVEIALLRDHAVAKLKAAGADHVIESVADLPALIDQLEQA